MKPTLSVVIPVYNYAATVARVIEQVQNAPAEVSREIVVVDDASTDGTRGILEALAAANGEALRLIVHPANHGKGAAVRTGIAAARGEIVLIQDADRTRCEPPWKRLPNTLRYRFSA
jgi:glycosyltransferase involved in cell wall biosynthesis